MQWFGVNLLVIVVIGVTGLWWLLVFTDYFELVGGLLGLGGVFAWVAFTGNLLLPERKDALQRSFDKHVLSPSYTLIFLTLIVVVVALLGPLRIGSFMLQPTTGSYNSILTIHQLDEGNQPIEPPVVDQLVSGNAIKIPLDVGVLEQKRFRIKLKGLPASDHELAWFERVELRIPEIFEHRTLVILRPKVLDAFLFEQLQASLTVAINGREYVVENYLGQSVWIGASADVPLDEATILNWRQAISNLEPAQQKQVQAQWLPPIGVAEGVVLVPTDEIRVTLSALRGETKFVSETTIKVPVTRPGRRVHDIELNGLERV